MPKFVNTAGWLKKGWQREFGYLSKIFFSLFNKWIKNVPLIFWILLQHKPAYKYYACSTQKVRRQDGPVDTVPGPQAGKPRNRGFILSWENKFFPSPKRPDCLRDARSSLVKGWQWLFVREKAAVGCSWTLSLHGADIVQTYTSRTSSPKWKWVKRS
jgi:hypothetical protein